MKRPTLLTMVILAVTAVAMPSAAEVQAAEAPVVVEAQPARCSSLFRDALVELWQSINVFSAPAALAQPPQEEHDTDPLGCWDYFSCGGRYATCQDLLCHQYDVYPGACYACVDGGTANARCKNMGWCPN